MNLKEAKEHLEKNGYTLRFLNECYREGSGGVPPQCRSPYSTLELKLSEVYGCAKCIINNAEKYSWLDAGELVKDIGKLIIRRIKTADANTKAKILSELTPILEELYEKELKHLAKKD